MDNSDIFIEKCIQDLKYSPLVITFMCFESVYNAPNGCIQLPEYGEKELGYHAVSVLGFSREKKCFFFQNSWGRNWGDNGMGSLPFEYFEHGLVGGFGRIIVSVKK